MTSNGRVNYAALPIPLDSNRWQRPHLAVAYLAPRTPLETQLALIWEEVLEVCPVGVDDHFLDLGGNSLRAMQCIHVCSTKCKTTCRCA